MAYLSDEKCEELLGNEYIDSENEFCGEKSITDARHVGLLGFQSRNGLIEMKCMNGGIARIMLDREFRANYIARIIFSDGRIIL